MDQTSFNGQLLVAIAMIASISIPLGTIMLKLNTTLNRLLFTMDVIERRVDNHDIRLDEQDDALRNVQINCARHGYRSDERNR
jgi:hypothetical protein